MTPERMTLLCGDGTEFTGEVTVENGMVHLRIPGMFGGFTLVFHGHSVYRTAVKLQDLLNEANWPKD